MFHLPPFEPNETEAWDAACKALRNLKNTTGFIERDSFP
jgi:hypothetical protein